MKTKALRNQLAALDPKVAGRLEELLDSSDCDNWKFAIAQHLTYRLARPKATVRVEGDTDRLLRGISPEVLEKWAREDAGDGSGNSSSS